LTRSGNKRTTNNQQPTTNYQQPWATKAGEATTLRRHLPAKLGVGVWPFGRLHNCRRIRAKPQYGVLKRLYPQSKAKQSKPKRSFLAGFLFLGKSQFCVFFSDAGCGYTDSRAKKAASRKSKSTWVVVSLSQSSGGFKFISSDPPGKREL